MRARRSLYGLVLGFMLAAGASVSAAAAPAMQKAPVSPYDSFVSGATVENGFIPFITKDGNVYLALSGSQLGIDLIETSVPSTGLGGFGPAAGEPYVAPARILRFERYGNKIVLRWPNTYTAVRSATPEALGSAESFPNSVVAVTPIVAEGSGKIVISADAFLGDLGNYEQTFEQENSSPLHGYRLDATRSFFETARAFPANDVLRVSQTWVSANPNLIDSAPDARSLEVVMTYNLIEAPHDGYVPRIADPRVGYFVTPLLDFSSDTRYTRNLYYIDRWNFAPARLGTPSVARHPIVYYLSNDIPVQYRSAVRGALLSWNKALARVGILNAIQVRQQPDDPNWDPEDIRHNVVRWSDTISSGGGGAEALIVMDPRTGELLNVGVNVLAGLGTNGSYHYVIAPERGLPDTPAAEEAYKRNLIFSVLLHESGHDLGLQHNFMAPYAYTAADLQRKAFTAKYGIASSVMAYTLYNLWPRGTPQGALLQLVLGPYDYHAIEYGYGYIRASTPRQELPELRKIASHWNNPLYRFASDEDAIGFASGRSTDPRVSRDILTNHPLAWCSMQHRMMHELMNSVLRRFPPRGESYDDARRAFAAPMEVYEICDLLPANTIGGEYLSRNDAGDPGAAPPLQAVSRSQEIRAWHFLSDWVFSDAAWRFNPQVLRHLTYSEHSGLFLPSWANQPAPRHDFGIVEQAAMLQDRVLNELFAPLTLERIDDLATKYRPGTTMSLADLFDWAQSTILGDIANGGAARDGVVRRNLQVSYTKRLAALWTAPAAGVPPDAEMLARLQLTKLETEANSALHRYTRDETTQSHVAGLAAIARQALEARATIASK